MTYVPPPAGSVNVQIQPINTPAPGTDPLQQTLSYYGLQDLGDFAWQEHLKGIPDDQIMLDIRQTPQYAHRFPAMKELAKQGRGFNETNYIDYENQYKGVLKAAGLPSTFYDTPDDISNALVNNVSVSEIQDRVKIAQNEIYNFDPNALSALEQYYGFMGRPEDLIGDLTAHNLDATRALPAIQNEFIAAQTGGAAITSGFGAISREQAESLAQFGFTADNAQQKAQEGFGTLANMNELFTNLPGEGGTGPTRDQGLAAVFKGDAVANQAIERKQAQRKSQFQQGGAFSENAKGVGGVGSA